MHKSDCALTIFKMFAWLDFVAATAALILYLLNWGMATADKTPMIAIVINNSTSVKPLGFNNKVKYLTASDRLVLMFSR